MTETAMTSDPTSKRIVQRLHEVEREHGVRVLYAVESGSRAWGFASPASDYDVRFIYSHSRDWYLSVDVEEQRDVIEYEPADGIDLNGWDLRKALKLLGHSNPSVVEWLQSPRVYLDKCHFGEQARALCGEVYSVQKGIHHYYNMAKSNYQGHLKAQLVPLKKYFHVLRALFAVRWLQAHGEPAPVEFERLRDQVQDQTALKQAIDKLLARRGSGHDKEFMPAIPALNEFIESELSALAATAAPSPATDPAQDDLSVVNKVFRRLLESESLPTRPEGA